MAKVKVQSFAEIKDALGSNEIEVEISDGSTLRDVFEKMAEEYGSAFKDQIWNKLTGEMEPFLVMLNEKTYSSLHEFETKVNDGDEIAILLPVVGG
jgi:MoaD family protein